MKVFLKLLPLLGTFALVWGFHQLGTLERGYSAVGGEVLFGAVAPLWYAFAHDKRRYRHRQQEKKEESSQDEY